MGGVGIVRDVRESGEAFVGAVKLGMGTKQGQLQSWGRAWSEHELHQVLLKISLLSAMSVKSGLCLKSYVPIATQTPA